MPKRLVTLFLIAVLLLPAGSAGAAEPSVSPVNTPSKDDGNVRPAWQYIDSWGYTANVDPWDNPSRAGVRCTHRTSSDTVDILVNAPDVTGNSSYSRKVGWRASVLQWNPDSTVTVVRQSSVFTGFASWYSPKVFSPYTFTGLPEGPTFKVVVDVLWYDSYGYQNGYLSYFMSGYKEYINSTFNTIWNGCWPIESPTILTSASQAG